MRSDLVQSSGRAVRTLLLALLLTPWLLIAVFASSAAEASSQTDTVTVPQALNLRSDGIEAQAQDLVLILMLSRTDCSYCALLKREIIGPMIASGDYQDKVMIRELLLDSGTELIDFDGIRTRADAIARRYDETLTPTLLFLSPTGAELAAPRRGVNTLEFYAHYLDKAIDKARAALPRSAVAADNPYGDVSVPLNLQQVPGQPVYYAQGKPGVPNQDNQGHTSNAGFVITDEGVVVYDALGTPALGFELLRAIRNLTDQPVRYVIAGHYHADHIYGLQAFAEHTDAVIWAHRAALEYADNSGSFSRGEDAKRRLAQRREALAPWVNEKTRIIAPQETFTGSTTLTLGGLHFDLMPLGPAHSPSDTALLVRELGIVFSGDMIYGGRVPFLDSSEVNTASWLAGLQTLLALQPAPWFVIPGHGQASDDLTGRLRFTKDYINYLRDTMGAAADDLIPFEEVYAQTDWSAYQQLPAFDASNRGNAYRVYLEMESEALSQ